MSRSQTNAGVVLAHTVAGIDVADRARRTWLAITGEARGPLMALIPVKSAFYWIVARLRSTKDHRSDPLALVDRMLITLAGRGYPESQLRLAVLHIDETVTSCYVGTAQRAPEMVDPEETEAEGRENNFATRRLALLARGETPDPDMLDQEALALRLEASLSIEKARGLERDARNIRAGRPPRTLGLRVAAGGGR